MKETDAAGNITGSFSPIDLTFSGGYTHDLTDCLRGGFAVKVAYSSYSQFSAVAIAADLALNYYDADRDLSLSVVAANPGRTGEAVQRHPRASPHRPTPRMGQEFRIISCEILYYGLRPHPMEGALLR